MALHLKRFIRDFKLYKALKHRYTEVIGFCLKTIDINV
jgi:hypothetical protein